MTPLARQALTLIYPARITNTPTWDTGPLPFTHGTIRADGDTRQTYHSPKASRLLYGTPEQPTRWHRWHTFHANTVTSIGVEILHADHTHPEQGWLILHLRGTGNSPLPTLRAAANRRGTIAPPFDVRELADGQAEPDLSTKPFTIAFITPQGKRLPALFPRLSYRHWPRGDQWLWTLASCTDLTDYPPDPHSRHDLLAPTLRLSADWRALVLRDGAAFVATRPDHGPDDAFFGFAETNVRSIYLDALLLGMLQDHAITHLEEQLGTALDGPRPHIPMADLEQDVTRFRQRLWWLHISRHGTGNDLLSAYQDQHHLRERFTQLNAEITEFNHTARDDTDYHVQATVGLVTLITIPATVAFAALQVIGVKTLTQLAVAIAIVLAVTAGLMLTRPARLVISATRQRLYRVLGQDHKPKASGRSMPPAVPRSRVARLRKLGGGEP